MKGAGRGDTANGVQGYSNIFAANISYGTGGNTERGMEVHVEDGVTFGNLLENFGQYGLLIGPPSAGNICGLHGLNKYIGNGGSGCYGIHEAANLDDVVFIGNAIRTVDRGINLTGNGRNRHLVGLNITDATNIAIQSSGTVDLLTMVGNAVDGATRATYIGGTVTRALIVGNNFDGLTDNDDLTIQLDGSVKSGLVTANAPTETQTTNANATNIYRVTLPTNTHVWIECTVIGIKSDSSDRIVQKIGGFFYNSAGTATQQGATASLITTINSAWGGSVPSGAAFSPTGAIIRVQVTGVALTTINWSCDVKMQLLT